MERLSQVISANIATKIVSVMIAVVLWFVVLGSRNVEVTKEVPLEIITPSDVIPANEIPEKIAFRLSGPKAFLRAILDRRDDPIRVNLSGAKPGLVTYRFFSDNIRVPIGVKVQSINPTAILVKLEQLKRRDVPVRLELRGIPPEGQRIARAYIRPEVVRIKGAESRVDGISEIFTMPVDVSSIQGNIEREVSLDLLRYNIQVDGPLPKVFIDLESMSANFRLRNVEVRVQASHQVQLSEKTVTVLVRANPKDLKNVDRTKVYATLDLRGKPEGKHTETLRVVLPDNIGLVKTVPEKITATLY